MLPIPDMQEPQDLIPYDEDMSLIELPPTWEVMPPDYEYDDLPPADFDPFTIEGLETALAIIPPPDLEHDLAELARRIEEAQSEMNTPDGFGRLNDLLEERDMTADELALQVMPSDPGQSLVDARFMSKADVDAEGQITGYTVQYIELYQDVNSEITGRTLDVGYFDDVETATETYQALQDSLADGTISLAEAPLLAQGMAEENGLPPGDWQRMTPDDQARYDYHVEEIDPMSHDVPPEDVAADPTFAGNTFGETAPDVEGAAAEQARLANEQALAALHGIGLVTTSEFDLARNSFYDPERGERLINGIFQQDPNDPTQNCSPMLISLTTAENGLGFAAQAVEFGQPGSLADVQADHDRVQSALEQDGVVGGLAEVEAIETASLEQDVPEPAMPGWSRDID